MSECRSAKPGREFDLGDILSITTGRLVSLRHMQGIYDLLNFLTGDSIYTHQIPRVMTEAKPFLVRWHPDLAAIDASVVTTENWREWLAEQKALFGEKRTIEPMSDDEHERIDPISELAEKVHPSKIIVVRP